MPDPTPGDGVLDTPGCPAEGDDMANAVDEGNLAIAMTAMANEFGAGAARRSNGADQLASDSQRMWSIAMTTPTQNAALALRTATESGSGRTRAETNRPGETSAAASQ